MSENISKHDVMLAAMSPESLTFEQQKELLMIRLEHEKMMQHKQLELEVMKHKSEMAKLELEQSKLQLIKEGKLFGGTVINESKFDVGTNLKLLPRFTEADPDLFFSLFERVAKSQNWSDECTLLLQCIFTGKAQEAYASLTVAE